MEHSVWHTCHLEFHSWRFIVLMYAECDVRMLTFHILKLKIRKSVLYSLVHGIIGDVLCGLLGVLMICL
jgi:cell shape-determining protein MreD